MCRDGNRQPALFRRAIHDAETGLKFIPRSDLVGHNGPDFRGLVDFEFSLSQPHALPGCDGHGQDPPTGEVVGCFEGNHRFTLFIGFDGRVPVADKFENGSKADVGASAAACVGTFFFKFLSSHQPHEKTEILKIKPVQGVKAFVWIEIVAPPGDQVKYGLVQDHHRQFNRSRVGFLVGGCR